MVFINPDLALFVRWCQCKCRHNDSFHLEQPFNETFVSWRRFALFSSTCTVVIFAGSGLLMSNQLKCLADDLAGAGHLRKPKSRMHNTLLKAKMGHFFNILHYRLVWIILIYCANHQSSTEIFPMQYLTRHTAAARWAARWCSIKWPRKDMGCPPQDWGVNAA